MLAPQGRRPLLVWLALSAVGLFCFPPALFLTLPVTLLVGWFYRDPERKTPDNPRAFVAPADGRVTEIVRTSHPYCGPAVKIGIFMNALNVHVNRMACAGTVEYLDYIPGHKWVASAPKASLENERFFLGYQTAHGRVLQCQIAGLVARRIACSVKKGDSFAAGQRYGMILLGSKVDVYLPLNAVLSVSVGARTVAGETVIAEVKE